jgi:hypothetical protein
MDEAAFERLYDKLCTVPEFKSQSHMSRKYGRIDDRIKLVIAIRFFAGANILDLRRELRIHKSPSWEDIK